MWDMLSLFRGGGRGEEKRCSTYFVKMVKSGKLYRRFDRDQ
jgi:hypothetical protein